MDVEGTDGKEGLALRRVWAVTAREGAGSRSRGLLPTQAHATLPSGSGQPAFLLVLLQHRPGTAPSLATGQAGTELVGKSAGRAWNGGRSVMLGTGTGGREAETRTRSTRSPANPRLVPRHVRAGRRESRTSPPAPPGLYALGRDTSRFCHSPRPPAPGPACAGGTDMAVQRPCSDPPRAAARTHRMTRYGWAGLQAQEEEAAQPHPIASFRLILRAEANKSTPQPRKAVGCPSGRPRDDWSRLPARSRRRLFPAPRSVWTGRC